MTRKSYVQIDGVLYDKENGYTGEDRDAAAKAGLLWNDRAYQDMGDKRFKSRSQHREYMKANNLTTVDDMHGDWKRAEKGRIDRRQGIDPSRKHDIARAISQLNSRSK
jgi:hypothetical protein